MATFRYVGPHSAVDIVLGPRNIKRVKRGGTLEVDAPAAEQLEASPNWEAVKAPAKPSGKSQEPKPEAS